MAFLPAALRRGARRRVARQPVALAYALILLLSTLATGPLHGPARSVRLLLGTGYEAVVEGGRWWTPLTSVFFVDNGAELLLALIGAIFLLGYAERLMGSGRTIIVFLGSALLGAAGGILLQLAGVSGGELWSRGVSELFALDPFTPIFGAIMAASCYAGPLWRRRIRVLTISTALVLLLYSGQPSDVYRLIAALVGLGIGVLSRPSRIDLTWRRSSHHETRTLLAAVVGVLAVGPIITTFSGARFGLLSPLGLLLTQDVSLAGDDVDRCLLGNMTRQCVQELTLERIGAAGPVLVSLLPLLTLFVAALGLARGRRFAAWLAIVINAGMAVLGAWFYGFLPISGQPIVWRWQSAHYWEIALVVSVVVPLATAVILAANLRRFPVRGRPGRLRRFALTVLLSGVGLVSLYVGAGWVLREHFRPTATLLDLVPAFWVVVITGAVLSLRTSTVGVGHDDEARLRALLTRGGGGSLAFMATWEGNSIWFSPSGSVAIAYRVVNGVAITTAGPIGEAGLGAEAIADFATMCDDHCWIPVFYRLHGNSRATFDRMGWQSMGIGEEIVLRPRTWAPTGKKWQDIRSSVNRADRAGVCSVWTDYRSLGVLRAVQIAEISELWVQEKKLPELGFTLGGLDELRDPAVRLMLAVDADERVHAVTSWMPCYRDGIVVGWTLDFMRRRPDSMNGVMEFLIAQTMQTLSEQPEIEFLSLSAAPLAQAGASGTGRGGERDGSLVARMLDFVGRSLEPVYGFRSLLAFKRKFQPEFQPLFMVYPDPVALPAIGIALARAYLPSLSMREVLAFARGLGEPGDAGRRRRNAIETGAERC